MHSKIEKIRANEKKAPAPRYDEEFYEGVAWLDSLGMDDADGD